MQAISTNNMLLKAAQTEKQANIAFFKTGLNPSNPELSYGYMPSAVDDDVKTNWQISQELQFPTLYLRKKQLSKLQVNREDLLLAAARQDILLQTQLTYIQLTYLDKAIQLAKKRFSDIEKLHQSLKRTMELGDASTLEVRRVNAEMISLKNALLAEETSYQKALQKLKVLNGGISITPTQFNYPTVSIENQESIWNELLKLDPVISGIKVGVEIAKGREKVTKNERLPSINLGYGAEKTDVEHFRGPQVGISIPLWENSNRSKQARLNAQLMQEKVENMLLEANCRLMQEYLDYGMATKALSNLQSEIDLEDNYSLLNKSLNLGQISVLDYLRELEWMYDTEDAIIQAEKVLIEKSVQLTRFRL
ncbi:TolC family protein [bacterium]|nr:TolC family protein [bacterium]